MRRFRNVLKTSQGLHCQKFVCLVSKRSLGHETFRGYQEKLKLKFTSGP